MSDMNDDFMTQVHAALIITISADKCVRTALVSQMKATYGEDWYEAYRDAIRAADTRITLKDISFHGASAFAEEIRIAKPRTHVNIQTTEPGGDFIANVTWNDQCAEFLEYETYTEEGARIIMEMKRQREVNLILKLRK